MKIYELLQLNCDSLKLLQDSGIKMKDYKYLSLFKEYMKIIGEGNKKTYAVAVLADKYNLSERCIYKMLEKLQKDCTIPFS